LAYEIPRKIKERGYFVMQKTQEKPLKTQPPVVREYEIGGTKYIVTATVRAGATEDAAAIVRRLIRNDLRKKAANK